MRRLTLQLVLVLLLLPPAAYADAWTALRDEFIEALFAAAPNFAASQGRHEFDGRFPDLSPKALDAKIAMFRSYKARAEALPAADLSGSAAFERDLLIWYCGRRLFWIETARWPYVSPEYYGGAFSPSLYVTQHYAPLPQRLAAFTRWLEALPKALDQMRRNLSGPMARVYVDRAIGRFTGLASYLESDVPAVFAAVDSQPAQDAYRTASARAVVSLGEVVAWLRKRAADADASFAMGENLFTAMLVESEAVTESLDELTAWNVADTARNQAALKAVCATYAPGQSIKACVERADAKRSIDGVVATATAQLATLEAFVRDNDLVSIPLADRARVAEAPPYQRANSAYIDRPGPLEQAELPAIYYISPPDPTWTVAEQRAYVTGDASLWFTSIHEVWPGHFLQGLHAKAHAPPLAQLLRATTFSEGWAHYSEELMWEAGFGAGDAALAIAQLKNALWRNVRFSSAIGLHAEGMTLAESERAFAEVAYLDPGNARQQAARGAYDPDYLSYTLGKLQIRSLRDEWTAPRGGRAAWKAFHDELLRHGAPPISLLRKHMGQAQ